MSKYYTPTIDEFYVGFEYQRLTYDKDPNGIHKTVTYPCDFIEYQQRLSALDGSLEEPKFGIRVKYLDKEDIESLGWVFEKQHPGLEESFYTKDTTLSEYDWLGMDHDTDSNYLRIFFSNFEGDTTRFSGIIKNKSELKKLMKQLQINE